MLINTIINYCDAEYKKSDTTHICSNCNHPNKCSGSCKKCLEQIHFPANFTNGKIDYDCENIINFYTCDYTYKYASEIWYLLRKCQSLKQINKYKVVSIGCGACPDLMAFESYIKENNDNKTISYFGIDKNKLWKPIHSQINNYRNSIVVKTRFIYEDAIEYFQTHSNLTRSANIIVLQYVISHFYNTSQINKVKDFFNYLISNIVSERDYNDPFIIIINDVNSYYRGRDYFIDIVEQLKKADFHGSWSQYYFNYRIKNDHQRYGCMHEKNSILYDNISTNLDTYEPWKSCSSAQMLIEIT